MPETIPDYEAVAGGETPLPEEILPDDDIVEPDADIEPEPKPEPEPALEAEPASDAEPATDTKPDEEQEQEQEPAKPTYSEDLLAVARKMGWREDGEKGPEEFILTAQDIIKTLKGTIGMFKDDQRDMKRQMAEMHRQFTERNAYETKRTIKTLETEADEAFEAGDKERYKALDNEITRLKAQLPSDAERTPGEPPGQPPHISDDLIREFNDWKVENEWYTENEELQSIANGVDTSIRHQHPEWTNKQVLDAVTKRMQPLINPPEAVKPPAPARRAPDVIDAAHRPAPAGKQKRLDASQLTPAQRRTASRFIDMGIYKNAQEYADALFEEENQKG